MKSLAIAVVVAMLCYTDVADSQAGDGRLYNRYASSGPGEYNIQYQDGRAAAEANNHGTIGNFETDRVQNGRFAAGPSVDSQSNTGVNVNLPQGMMGGNSPSVNRIGRQFDGRTELRTVNIGETPSGRAAGYDPARQGMVNVGWNRGGATNSGNVFTGAPANGDTGGRGLNNRWIPRQGDSGNFGGFVGDLNRDSGMLNDGFIQEATSLLTQLIQNGNAGELLRNSLFTGGDKARNSFVANGDAGGTGGIQGNDARNNFPNRNFAGRYLNSPLGTGIREPLPNGQIADRSGNTPVVGGLSEAVSNVRNVMVDNRGTSGINAPSTVQGYGFRNGLPNRNVGENIWNGPPVTRTNVPLENGQIMGRPRDIPIVDRPINGASNVRDGSVVNGDIRSINSLSRVQEYDSRNGLPNRNFGGNVWNGPPGTRINVPFSGGQNVGRPGATAVVDRRINSASNVRDGPVVYGDNSGINAPSRVQGYDSRNGLPNKKFGENIWNGPPGTRTNVPLAGGQIVGRLVDMPVADRQINGDNNKRDGSVVINRDISGINAPNRVQGYYPRKGLDNRNFGGNTWNEPPGTRANVPFAAGQIVDRRGDMPVVSRPINGANNIRDGSVVNGDISGVNAPNRVQGYDPINGLPNRDLGGNIWNENRRTDVSPPPGYQPTAGRPGDITVGGGSLDSAQQGNSRTVGGTNAMYPGGFKMGKGNQDVLVGNPDPFRRTFDESQIGKGFLENESMRNGGTGSSQNGIIENGNVPSTIIESPVTKEDQTIVSPDKSIANSSPTGISESTNRETAYGSSDTPETGSSNGASVAGSKYGGDMSGTTNSRASSDEIKKGHKMKDKKGKGKKGKGRRNRKKSKTVSGKKGGEDTNQIIRLPSDADDESKTNVKKPNSEPERHDIFGTDDDADLIRILGENGKAAKGVEGEMKDSDIFSE